MIVVFFDNEEYARVPDAVRAEYEMIKLPKRTTGPYALVCKDSEGNTVGAFLLEKIVGWCLDEEEDDDDEDDDDDEEDEDEEDEDEAAGSEERDEL